MSLTKLSLNTRMIGFMSDTGDGVLFIQVYLLDQQFGISKQMFERCQMS
ncbi:Uncharacterised protein [Shigella sonnei]|nr:Uncharacterised protein [Shigella sonnei]